MEKYLVASPCSKNIYKNKTKKPIGKKSHTITSRNNQRWLTLHPFKIIWNFHWSNYPRTINILSPNNLSFSTCSDIFTRYLQQSLVTRGSPVNLKEKYHAGNSLIKKILACDCYCQVFWIYGGIHEWFLLSCQSVSSLPSKNEQLLQTRASLRRLHLEITSTNSMTPIYK